MAPLTWKRALRDLLLTLVTVCALAGCLSAVLLLLGLCTGTVSIKLEEARPDTARRDLADLRHVLRLFYAKHGRWPSAQEGLGVLVKEGLLESAPLDPWGRPYGYVLLGRGPPWLWSRGADGTPGGVGDDADLLDWSTG